MIHVERGTHRDQQYVAMAITVYIIDVEIFISPPEYIDPDEITLSAPHAFTERTLKAKIYLAAFLFKRHIV